MGLHAFTEYLKYWWKAKGRHGTHSPFVYALVEAVLQGDANGLVVESFKDSRYGKLLSAIAAYYNYNTVLDLNVNSDIPQSYARSLRAPSKQDLDMVVLPEQEPEQWVDYLHTYISIAEKGGIIVAPSIHKTKAFTKNWDRLRADESVKLSIDLYGIGLLFARKEFKVKQHFVLKAAPPKRA